jgi:hypothetical protein
MTSGDKADQEQKIEELIAVLSRTRG